MLVFSLTIQKGTTQGLTLDESGGGTKKKNVDLSQPDSGVSPPTPLSDAVTLVPLRGSQPAPIRGLGVSGRLKCFACVNSFDSRSNPLAVIVAIRR